MNHVTVDDVGNDVEVVVVEGYCGALKSVVGVSGGWCVW